MSHKAPDDPSSDEESFSQAVDPGSFQLFLPDPDMVDRLQEVPHPAGSAVAEGRVEVDVTDSLFLTDIPSNEDLPQPSPRERKKRVVIADPPTVQVQEIENEGDPSASFRQRLGSAGRAAKQGKLQFIKGGKLEKRLNAVWSILLFTTMLCKQFLRQPNSNHMCFFLLSVQYYISNSIHFMAFVFVNTDSFI